MHEYSRKASARVTIRNKFPQGSMKSKNKKQHHSLLSGSSASHSPWLLSCYISAFSETSHAHLWCFPIKDKKGTAHSIPGGQRLARFVTAMQSFPVATKSLSPTKNNFKRAQSLKYRNLYQQHVQEEFDSSPNTKDDILWSLKTAEPPFQSLGYNLALVRYKLLKSVKCFLMMVCL